MPLYISIFVAAQDAQVEDVLTGSINGENEEKSLELQSQIMMTSLLQLADNMAR